MKTIFLMLCSFGFFSFGNWHTDFEKAKAEAAEKHRVILLNFSGSDWCGPCIRLRKEIFESDAFKEMADASLVLVNADFPRSNKNKLGKEQQAKNDALAEKYNPEGRFPFTLLLTAQGKLVKAWDGYPETSPAIFIAEIKALADAH